MEAAEAGAELEGRDERSRPVGEPAALSWAKRTEESKCWKSPRQAQSSRLRWTGETRRGPGAELEVDIEAEGDGRVGAMGTPRRPQSSRLR